MKRLFLVLLGVLFLGSVGITMADEMDHPGEHKDQKEIHKVLKKKKRHHHKIAKHELKKEEHHDDAHPADVH